VDRRSGRACPERSEGRSGGQAGAAKDVIPALPVRNSGNLPVLPSYRLTVLPPYRRFIYRLSSLHGVYASTFRLTLLVKPPITKNSPPPLPPAAKVLGAGIGALVAQLLVLAV
jgi:hypothetical protein